MSEAITGGCLCGRVRYRVSGPFDRFHLCHCSQCRRSTGSAHAANIFTLPERLEWLAGENLIKRYTPDEPDVISKCFCTHCGSLVPYTSLKSGKLVIPAGSLDQAPGIGATGLPGTTRDSPRHAWNRSRRIELWHDSKVPTVSSAGLT